MTGIVLAGGRSLRFGENKALAQIRGKRLLDHVVEAHRAIFEEVIVVAGRVADFPDLACSVVADLLPQRGPLGGIATGLFHASFDRAFVTACDMPFLRKELLAYLAKKSQGKEVVVPVLGERPEPLHAVYSRSCLPHAMESLAQGAARIIEFYPRVNVLEICEDDLRRLDPDLLSFFNINTREDLDQAETIVSSLHSPPGPAAG